MRQQTLLVLSAGPLQLPAIQTAKRMGLRVIAADGNPRAIGLAQADVALAIDIRSPEAVLTAVEGFQLDGAITICTEMPLRALAAVNERFNLAGLRPGMIEQIVDKNRMRHCFEIFGAPSPRSILCTTLDEALAAFHAIAGRAILKPAVGMGSRGIFDLMDEAEVAPAFDRAVACSLNGRILVEEFAEGPEFSVESLTWNGRTEVVAITDKITTGSPYWVEMGHSQPARISHSERESLIQATQAGVKAIGLDWSATHTEIKLTPKGPRIIEVGGRLGGDFITTRLTPLSSGVDMVEGAINLALGQVPNLSYFPSPKGAAIRYLAAQEGYLQEEIDLGPASSAPGVVEVGTSFHRGDRIPPVRSSGDRTAWVIAKGEDSLAAIHASQTGLALIRPNVESCVIGPPSTGIPEPDRIANA